MHNDTIFLPDFTHSPIDIHSHFNRVVPLIALKMKFTFVGLIL